MNGLNPPAIDEAAALPTLQLRRLRVMKSGHVVYDQAFHDGVNIIRGDNGSGKSSIADFIFFVLGGEFENWKKVPAQCDEIQAEILTTRGRLIVRRETSSKASPIHVFFGEFEDAMASGLDGWERFPAHRQGDHESFSQLMFRSMCIPEAQSDGASNITMHQILRLLYADQQTPPGRLFRFESTWDTKAIRGAVGDLICGLNDYEAYETTLKIRDLEKDYEQASRQLSALLSVLPPDTALNRPEAVGSQIAELERQRDQALDRIARVDDLIDTSETKSFIAQSRSARDAIEKQSSKIESLERLLAKFEYELDDLVKYTEFLDEMIEKVGLAEKSSDALGGIEFTQCPACLTELAPPQADHTCHVCKSEIDPEQHRSRYNVIRLDFEIQRREAYQLNSQKLARFDETKKTLRALRTEHAKSVADYSAKFGHGAAPRDAFLATENLRVGQIAKEIEYLEQALTTAEKIRDLSDTKARLQSELDSLKSRQEALELHAKKRRRVALTLVSDLAVKILHLDNKHQPEFENAQTVNVSFTDDAMIVDGDMNFAESSNVVLKNACILSLLLAAGNDSKFFHPRFALFDNIEDKGMTTDRSHNFQKILVEMVTELKVPYQVIYTTSMMNPALELDDYVIGPHYTPENRTLSGIS